jgi:hypothetical protein
MLKLYRPDRPIFIAENFDRLLPFGRGRTPQHAFRTQVFINCFPMHPVARPTALPLLPLIRRRIQQTRIPHQWHRNRPTIHQINPDRLIGKMDILHPFIRLDCHQLGTWGYFSIDRHHNFLKRRRLQNG